MHKVLLIALAVPAVLAGCFGAAADMHLSVTTHLVDRDSDDRKDIEVLLAFQDADSAHTRTAGSGTLTMERARGDHNTQELNYADYGRIPITIEADSDRWRDLGDSVVYVHVIEDHQVDSGYSYRITIEIETADGGTVSGSTETYYQRR